MHRCPVLFTASSLLVILASICLSGAEDKPMSRDLGKVQPPGGVPLPLGKPGTAITVDYTAKASKRLESAPTQDLDKWVLELERITGKKLEGDVARQACRTYFVTRMSVV